MKLFKNFFSFLQKKEEVENIVVKKTIKKTSKKAQIIKKQTPIQEFLKNAQDE